MDKEFASFSAVASPYAKKSTLAEGVAALERYIKREIGSETITMKDEITGRPQKKAVTVTIANLAEKTFSGIAMDWTYPTQGKTLAQVMTVLMVSGPETIGEDWHKLEAYAHLIIENHAEKFSDPKELYEGLKWIARPRVNMLMKRYQGEGAATSWAPTPTTQ